MNARKTVLGAACLRCARRRDAEKFITFNFNALNVAAG